jgi:hypothetical protein
MSTKTKKSTVKKSAAKKTGTKKTAAKKTGAKKTASRKVAARKTAVKKATAKKTAVKKTAIKKTSASKADHDHAELSRIAAENLHAVAMDIDRQMKTFAEIDTRVLIAKDQLADFQEMIQEKIKAFQKKHAGRQTEIHTDIMKSIRAAKDEAAKFIKESEAIHDAYESLVKQLEKGRKAAARETKKAEIVFKEKFHEVEEKLLKKASEIKENIKNK